MDDVYHLIYLCADELFVPAEVLRRHQVLDDVDQQPKSVLFVHKEEGNGGDAVEALAILHIWIMDAKSTNMGRSKYSVDLNFWQVSRFAYFSPVGQQNPSQFGYAVRVRPVVVLVIGQSPQQVQLNLLCGGRQVSAAGVVVGQELLVVIGLMMLRCGGAHEFVIHYSLPDGSLK
jgi:hypothetical protein